MCDVVQALYMLLQCDHDIDKASHKHKLNAVTSTGLGPFLHDVNETIVCKCSML